MIVVDQPERQTQAVSVIANLTEVENNRLCDLIELLDRWDREYEAKHQFKHVPPIPCSKTMP